MRASGYGPRALASARAATQSPPLPTHLFHFHPDLGYANISTTFASKPFLIVGQPCNQFGSQEPGDNDEIVNCVQYVRPGHGYVLPAQLLLLQKADVNGVFASALFKTLKEQCGGADVGWNFEAFLVDKTGLPIKRYTTGAGGGPLSFVDDIAKALA